MCTNWDIGHIYADFKNWSDKLVPCEKGKDEAIEKLNPSTPDSGIKSATIIPIGTAKPKF